MTQTSPDALSQSLAARGVSRRDFLAWCGATAALIGLNEAMAPQVARALSAGARLKPVVWLAQGLCTGCTESVAQLGYPDVPTLVLDILSIDYWETVMAAAGAAAEKAKTDAIEAGGYILVVEGAIMKGFDGSACRIAGRTGLEHLREAAAKADAILAIGSCAVDGGWCAARPNPGGAVGVKDVPELTGGRPVVNLPTCPVNPEWVVAVIVNYLLLGKLPAVDAEGRPSAMYDSTIHDTCPRRGHFEAGEFVDAFGTPQEAAEWCLYRMGCKGPQTLTNCPRVRWNRKVSWCVESGSPCIGCGNLGWVDRDAPFLQRMPDTLGLRPETIGAVVGAATLGALAVHGIAQTMTGRMGHGAPVEQRVIVEAMFPEEIAVDTSVTAPVGAGLDTEGSVWDEAEAWPEEEPEPEPEMSWVADEEDADGGAEGPPPVAEGQETFDLPDEDAETEGGEE